MAARRVVTSTNHRHLGYRAALNHISDWTEEAKDKLRGRRTGKRKENRIKEEEEEEKKKKKGVGVG